MSMRVSQQYCNLSFVLISTVFYKQNYSTRYVYNITYNCIKVFCFIKTSVYIFFLKTICCRFTTNIGLIYNNFVMFW